MNTKKIISFVLSIILIGAFAIVAPVLAAEKNKPVGQGRMMNRGQTPVVFGKVSAISGNILTVIENQRPNKDGTASVASKVFTVDATNAKVSGSNNSTVAVSIIAVGDTVVVQGTVSGTNVVATTIRDMKGNSTGGKDNNQAPLQIQGNGQPVVAGTISVINGSTLTITNKSSVVYTIDATSAKITQGKKTILVSGMKVGDSVVVQGTVNGTSIVASTIIDQTKAANTGDQQGKKMGFFGSVGQFFSRMFGF